MKLQQGTIRPGTVLQVLDNGAIKASAPGLFSFADDPSLLPPIMPWQIGSNCNSFSKPKQYDEVWILNFNDNPLQLYWFRKDSIASNSNIAEINTEKNVEILCNKEANGEWATIYFSDGSGWVISKGKTVMGITANGDISLTTGLPHRTIEVNSGGISLGSPGESAHPAACADAVMDTLYTLVVALKQMQMVATPNPYTMAIGTVLAAVIPALESKIPKIASSHVTID